MFNTFGGSAVNPAQISYSALAMTGNVTLTWPSFQGSQANAVALVMDVTANAGGYNLTFPDATAAGKGSTALLRNTGAQTITILANDGTTIATLAAGVAKFLYLTANSTTGGVWGIVTFGTGTSAADASVLAGYGLQAIAATLNQAHPTTATSATITVSAPNDIAKVYVATGGSVAANLPTAASAGSNFFTIIKNNGTGTVTITPNGADTIDGAATLALAPNDSAMICSLGGLNAWVSIGFGRSVAFAFTQLVKNVAGGVDVTLTAAECANKVMTFTGLLTGNINVIVTNTVSVYYIYNNTTGAFTLTVKTAAGTGISVAQGTRDVGVCDGSNVLRAVTNVSASTSFGVGSAGSPSVTFVGNSSTGLYVPSANVMAVTANGFEVMSFNGPAASVNWFDAFAAGIGLPPRLVANGTDTNIGLRLLGKGTGKVQFADGTDTTKVVQFDESGITTGTTRTLVIPDANDTLVGKATTDTLTNKTFDTAGAGNVLRINGTGITAVTGTGSVVLSASPTLSGTVGGALTFSGALTLSSALTYGGVTLTNAVTGTGSMVLSASPTLSGTLSAAAGTFSSTLGVTGASTLTGNVQVGATAVQSSAILSVVAGGNNIEFGHTNTAGFRSHLGAHNNDGTPFLAFNAEEGTAINTYRTRGIKGSVIQSDLAGGWVFKSVTNANADSQAGTDVVTISTAGNMQVSGTLGVTGATTLSSALTYGGVALNNAVTGTGNMVLSASPTLSGTVGGALTFSGAMTMSSALTYGGVTLANAVTGTGNMVLSASPTLSGTVGGALTFSGALTMSSALTYGGVTLSNAVTGTGNMVLSASPTFTGTTTIATLALTSVGAHTISGAITYGGVTLNNAVTGTGNMVLSSAPTLTNVANTTQTLTDAATIVWDMNSGQVAKVTLTASGHTLGLPTNIKNGSSGFFDVIQDAGGGKTMLWNSVYKFVGGVTPTLSTGANARDRFYWSTFDGSSIDITQAKGMA